MEARLDSVRRFYSQLNSAIAVASWGWMERHLRRRTVSWFWDENYAKIATWTHVWLWAIYWRAWRNSSCVVVFLTVPFVKISDLRLRAQMAHEISNVTCDWVWKGYRKFDNMGKIARPFELLSVITLNQETWKGLKFKKSQFDNLRTWGLAQRIELQWSVSRAYWCIGLPVFQDDLQVLRGWRNYDYERSFAWSVYIWFRDGGRFVLVSWCRLGVRYSGRLRIEPSKPLLVLSFVP